MTHAEIIAEARDKYTVHECNQCAWDKCCSKGFGSEECGKFRESVFLKLGIEDGYFTQLLDRLEAAHRREVQNALDAGGFVEASRKNKQVGNAAKLREALEYPKDANDKYIHIGDAVHMLNTNHEGDHEWDDVVLSFEYVGKGGGDDWLVYGEDGAAWACECEVLKQEGDAK